MDLKWICDEVKSKKELTTKTKKKIREKWRNKYRRKNRKASTNRKFNRIVRKVLNSKDAKTKEIIYSVLSFNEFVRRIEDIAVGIYSGDWLEVAVAKQKTMEKDLLECYLYEELQAIKRAGKLTEEIKKQLIFLKEAVITEKGDLKIHPLLKEIIEQKSKIDLSSKG